MTLNYLFIYLLVFFIVKFLVYLKTHLNKCNIEWLNIFSDIKENEILIFKTYH